MGSVNRKPLVTAYFPEQVDFDPAFDADVLPRLALVSIAARAQSWKYRRVKRAIDIVGASLMAVALLLPGLFIAAVIALNSRGSVFYRETRVGRGGRHFRIWKFRTMHARGVEDARLHAIANHDLLSRWRTHKDIEDPRVTPVGRFLRRWSLDEVPQLLNVLRGEMSLVGPRPVVRAELPLYGRFEAHYLAATPGLSGLWQVSGRSNVSFAERASLDASYVRTWSLRSDISILLRTIPVVLRRVGAR